VCTGVDLEECARIANVLALETAVQGEEIAVQAEEIERLQGVLQQSMKAPRQTLSREDESAKHYNILEIGDAAKSLILEPIDTVLASKAGSGHDDLAGDRNDAPAKIPTRFTKSSKFCPWPPWAPPGPKQAGRNPRTA
jgi:hypothetical protein